MSTKEIPEDVREAAWRALNESGWDFLKLGVDPSTPIAHAILAERERAAKIVDIWAKKKIDGQSLSSLAAGTNRALVCRKISAAIRSGATP